MSDAKVRSHEHDHVRLLEIVVRIRRSIEAERLFVRGGRGGHALPRVAVAVQHAHAELGQAAEEGHFLGGDLAGAEKGHGVWPVLLLNGLHSRRKRPQCYVPIDRAKLAVLTEQWRGGAVVGLQDLQRLPALGAGHAEIHRILRFRTEAHRLAVAKMDLQPAAGRAKAADHRRYGVGGLARRDFPQTETARIEHQIAGQLAVACVEQVFEALSVETFVSEIC